MLGVEIRCSRWGDGIWRHFHFKNMLSSKGELTRDLEVAMINPTPERLSSNIIITESMHIHGEIESFNVLGL